MNDSPVDYDGVPRSELASFGGSRQSREVTAVKSSAENLARPGASNPLPVTKIKIKRYAYKITYLHTQNLDKLFEMLYNVKGSLTTMEERV